MFLTTFVASLAIGYDTPKRAELQKYMGLSIDSVQEWSSYRFAAANEGWSFVNSYAIMNEDVHFELSIFCVAMKDYGPSKNFIDNKTWNRIYNDTNGYSTYLKNKTYEDLDFDKDFVYTSAILLLFCDFELNTNALLLGDYDIMFRRYLFGRDGYLYDKMTTEKYDKTKLFMKRFNEIKRYYGKLNI